MAINESREHCLEFKWLPLGILTISCLHEIRKQAVDCTLFRFIKAISRGEYTPSEKILKVFVPQVEESMKNVSKTMLLKRLCL